MLARLARFSFRKRRIMVFAIWLPLLTTAALAARHREIARASRADGEDDRVERREIVLRG